MKKKNTKLFFITHLTKLLPGIVLGYGTLFVVTNLFFNYVLNPESVRVLSPQNATKILPIFFLSVGLSFGIGIYLFNSWLAKKWIKLEFPKVILFMGAMAAIGPIGEVLVSTISMKLWGHPLWVYKLLPVHGGDTSVVMSVLWPVYGFHVYCFHKALKARFNITNDADLSFFVGLDAITIEVLVNLFSLSFFYTYIFYYLAGDLWHLSTAVIFIPYVVCGYVIVKVLHLLEKDHHRIITGISGFVIGWLVIFII